MSHKPLAIVTCGPALEPIDAVRCITNHSTGELGTILSNTLAEAGFDVVCLRGDLATAPASAYARNLRFSTNASLLTAIRDFAPRAVFHAAALCDFLVSEISGVVPAGKIRSDAPDLTLRLSPAPKILPQLRDLFPQAVIVGWKFEIDGTREQALARGHRQLRECRTDACVVNGSAYGDGFGVLESGATTPEPFGDKRALSTYLARWTLGRIRH